MKVFLTGATGYVGGAIAEALLAAGHKVVGLARTIEAEQKLKDAGITPALGDLHKPEAIGEWVASADGVIHAGTTNDGRIDTEAVRAMLGVLKGTHKPLIYTSGVWVLGNTGDAPAGEDAPVNPPTIAAWRPAVEREVLNATEDVRSIVIRPGMVYGRGAGLFGIFIQSAVETGAARYIGDGRNRWATVHVEDLADLYVRAFEKATPGSLFHAAEGPAVTTREIAEAASFGADAGGKTEAMPREQAEKKFGPYLVEALLLHQVVSAERAKQMLGWRPAAVSVLEDLRYGSYAMSRINP